MAGDQAAALLGRLDQLRLSVDRSNALKALELKIALMPKSGMTDEECEDFKNAIDALMGGETNV